MKKHSAAKDAYGDTGVAKHMLSKIKRKGSNKHHGGRKRGHK